jgi:hypothetical protein
MPRRLNRPLTLIVPVLLLSVAACAKEAPSAARPVDMASLRDFHAIEVTGPDDVIVAVGKDFSVRAEGDPKAIEQLKIKVDGGTLEIGRRDRSGLGWSNDKGATIRVTLPALDAVSLTGSGNVDVDRVEAKILDIDLTGSGDLRIGAVRVDALEADLTGSGDIMVAGEAGQGEISITGSGNFVGTALKIGKGEASILGSGNIDFASDGAIDISILGSGDVTVKGRAQCKTSSMGSGEARCAP